MTKSLLEKPRQIAPLRRITAQDIADVVRGTLIGSNRIITCARPTSGIVEGALAFARPGLKFDGDADAIILVRPGHATEGNNTFIEVGNPRLAFAIALQKFFWSRDVASVAPSACVAPSARIGSGAFIGEHVTVENDVSIGQNPVLQHGAVLYSHTSIGDDCAIFAGAIIGAAGFGYERDADGVPHFLPHFGGVAIGNRVDVGPNSTILRGVMNDTIVADDTKIGALVYIAHGAKIGRRCRIAAGAKICGSATLEDDVWVGPNATISDSLNIGAGAQISLGSVVTQNVAPQQRVTGNFAVDHSAFVEALKRPR